MTTARAQALDVRPWPASDVVTGVSCRTGETVQRMLDAFVAEIPFYQRLPQEQLHVDIAQVCRDNLTSFFRCCREGRLPASGELAAARAGAARRAEEGVPLDALVLAYTIGNRVTWQALAEQVPPEREHEVRAFTPYVFRYLHAMLEEVTRTYVEERRAIEHDEGSAAHDLVQRLLDGAPAQPLAQRLGVTLADAYLVVALHLEDHDDERVAGVDSRVAARRKVRRVQTAVTRLPGQAASLAVVQPEGGIVLLPGIGPRLPGRAESQRTVQTLADAAGASATAVTVPAETLVALPEAAAQAQELLRLARTLGRPAGVYTLDDLVLEHQLALDGPSRRRLAAMLHPLVRHPDLLPTARAWLRNERARRETAEELHVHPNTLDKRLERLSALTGIEVGTTRGIAVLQAGLVALDVEAAGAGPVVPEPGGT